jgi:hypothetical protein
LEARLEPIRVEHLKGYTLMIGSEPCPQILNLVEVNGSANTLAYYDMEIIIYVKSVILQDPG